MHLNKLGYLPDEHNEVKLALEVVGCAINIQTLGWLLACLDEVLHNLWLDLELVDKHGLEEGDRKEPGAVRVKADQLTHRVLDELKGAE